MSTAVRDDAGRRARYVSAGAWTDQTVGDVLRAAAARVPEHVAAVSATDRITYRHLDERSDRLAAALLGAGLVPGDRVVVQLGNEIETVVCFYGLVKAGLVPVCSLAQHGAYEIDAFLGHSDARAHLVQGDVRNRDMLSFQADRGRSRRVFPLAVRADPADGRALHVESLIEAQDLDTARRRLAGLDPDPFGLAVLQLSGGTTGVPKLIPRTHADYVCNARALAAAWDWDDTTVVLRRVVLMHNAGLVSGLLPAHLAGGTAVLSPLRALAEDLRLVEAERVTDAGLGAAATADLVALLRAGAPELPHLRQWIVSGTAVSPDLCAELELAGGVPVVQLFGMGEGLFLAGRRDHPAALRHSTVGTPISELDEVRILAPGTEDELPDGVEGELTCAGPYTITGYHGDPRPESFTAAGAYRTGDLASAVSVDGVRAYRISGRIKDLVNRGGEKISPIEVESLLDEHPAVAVSAIVAMPDPRLGERACAYVVPVSPAEAPTLAELTAFLLAAGLSKFKLPERLETVDALPRTPIGKIDKKALRADVEKRMAS